MAQTTITLTHLRASDYKGSSTDAPRTALNKVLNLLSGALGSSYQATSLTVSQDPASATVTLSGVGGTASSAGVTLSGVGGTAASGTVTLAGGAGNVTIVTDGTSVGPVAFNTSDAQTATDCITALNANGTFAAKATASSGGSGVVRITWGTKGTVGNAKTLTASRTLGTATASGATLAGGVQGSVSVTVGGNLVTTNTTNLTDAAAATAIAAALDADAAVFALADATPSSNVVGLLAQEKGANGDSITLVSTSATGTATASGATFSGGADGAVTVSVNGTDVDTNTTDLTDAGAATLIASGLNDNATISALVTASASGAVVTLTANAAGESGNAIAISSSSSTGSATASAAGLSGGTSTTYTL